MSSYRRIDPAQVDVLADRLSSVGLRHDDLSSRILGTALRAELGAASSFADMDHYDEAFAAGAQILRVRSDMARTGVHFPTAVGDARRFSEAVRAVGHDNGRSRFASDGAARTDGGRYARLGAAGELDAGRLLDVVDRHLHDPEWVEGFLAELGPDGVAGLHDAVFARVHPDDPAYRQLDVEGGPLTAAAADRMLDPLRRALGVLQDRGGLGRWWTEDLASPDGARAGARLLVDNDHVDPATRADMAQLVIELELLGEVVDAVDRMSWGDQSDVTAAQLALDRLVDDPAALGDLRTRLLSPGIRDAGVAVSVTGALEAMTRGWVRQPGGVSVAAWEALSAPASTDHLDPVSLHRRDEELLVAIVRAGVPVGETRSAVEAALRQPELIALGADDTGHDRPVGEFGDLDYPTLRGLLDGLAANGELGEAGVLAVLANVLAVVGPAALADPATPAEREATGRAPESLGRLAGLVYDALDRAELDRRRSDDARAAFAAASISTLLAAANPPSPGGRVVVGAADQAVEHVFDDGRADRYRDDRHHDDQATVDSLEYAVAAAAATAGLIEFPPELLDDDGQPLSWDDVSLTRDWGMHRRRLESLDSDLAGRLGEVTGVLTDGFQLAVPD